MNPTNSLMISPHGLVEARRSGRYLMKTITVFLGLIAICAAYVVGNQPMVFVASAGILCLLSIYARFLFGRYCDNGLVTVLIAQTALITTAFEGHPWQIDSHMIYFVSLAMCILLIKPHLLFLAAALIVLHHAVLAIFLPALVYPASDLWPTIARTGFHGLVVVMETAVLTMSVRRRLSMLGQAQHDTDRLMEAKEEARSALQVADEARTAALHAQRNAEQEAQRAQDALTQAHQNAENMRQTDAAMRANQARHQEEKDAADQALAAVIADLSDALENLAAKRLDRRLVTPFPPSYEKIRSDYNSAIEALTVTISQVAAQVDTLQGNAGAIAGTTQTQSELSEARASSLQDVAVSLRELTASVAQVAQNATHANETVATSRAHADQAVLVLGNASSAMTKIHDSASEIGKIVSLIEDIAFQTNLLSLNAGVEAARAGEAGRGFAVVATEVRALAARSSNSANEIRALIARSDDEVKTGVALVNESGAALEQILELVARTDSEVKGIDDSVQEQNARLGTITKVLDDLSTASQEDAAIIEQTALATANMDEASEGLAQSIAVFEVGQTPPAAETSSPEDPPSPIRAA